MDNIWSVFENHHAVDKNGKQKWVTELVFYKGDLSKVDLATDWRFREVKGKRSQLKYLGMCETSFPVKYPLRLDNGDVINEKVHKIE